LLLQAELLELVAKDEKDKEIKKAKKKGKKKIKGEGKEEQLLCGCGAVCDAACSNFSQGIGQRSSSSSPARAGASPVGAPGPSTPPRSPQLDSSTGRCSTGGKDNPEQSKVPPAPKQSKNSLRSPARSTLGAELMSPKRPTAKAGAAQPAAAAAADAISLGAGWETIPAAGKGRRSGAAAPRKAVAVLEPRGASPEPPRRQLQSRHSAQPVAVAAHAGSSRQPQGAAVRAVPVTSTAHVQAALAKTTLAAEHKASPEGRAPPVTAKAAAAKAAAGLSSADPVISKHPVSSSLAADVQHAYYL